MKYAKLCLSIGMTTFLSLSSYANNNNNGECRSILAQNGAGQSQNQNDLGAAINQGIGRISSEVWPLLIRKAGVRPQTLWSPQNIQAALVLMSLGADEQTRQEILEYMGVPSATSPESLAEAYKSEIARLKSAAENDDVILETATKIWMNRDLQTIQFSSGFQNLAEMALGTESESLPFSQPESVGSINKWGSDNTHEMIPEIVKNIGGAISLMTTSTFIKGNWTGKPFKPQDTAENTFFGIDQNTTMPFMSKVDNVRYFQGEGYKVVTLPVGEEGKFGLTIMLPSAGNFHDLVKKLKTGSFAKIMSQVNSAESNMVQLSIPRFRVTTDDRQFHNHLQESGLERLFQGGLTNALESGPLPISEIAHLADLQVNEFGFAAAAVTVVSSRGMSPRAEYSFNANRPFVAVIQEIASGQPLFISTVTNPEPLQAP